MLRAEPPTHLARRLSTQIRPRNLPHSRYETFALEGMHCTDKGDFSPRIIGLVPKKLNYGVRGRQRRGVIDIFITDGPFDLFCAEYAPRTPTFSHGAGAMLGLIIAAQNTCLRKAFAFFTSGDSECQS